MRWMRQIVTAGILALVFWLGSPASTQAQMYNLTRMHYYPYNYFPHSYWPVMSPVWPERPGEPYRRPPAYQSYPAFHEPNWRYEMDQPMSYYRGFHFWLDAF